MGVVLVSLLLTLDIFHTLSNVSIVDFEHVIAGWVNETSSGNGPWGVVQKRNQTFTLRVIIVLVLRSIGAWIIMAN